MDQNRGLDLEKELTCSICTEVLYQPLTLLDCLHTFCGGCLKEWFTWQHTASHINQTSTSPSRTSFTCPSCRASVRETKHNATVTTLLEMFLAANPDKARTAAEKQESKIKYKPGDDVMPKFVERERTPRERRFEDEDRRLVNEVQLLSLQEAGVETRAPSRRRGEERARGAPRRSVTDIDMESRESRNIEIPERRRRAEGDGEGERRQRQPPAGSSTSSLPLRPDGESSADRRLRRNRDAARRRHEETNRTAARQIEHQSSLRSLISSSDVDSHEMEEEILRQIQEEGLLDGIDLDNIDVNQEDQISERIAEAFRRRQRERSGVDSTRRSESSPGTRNTRSSASDTRVPVSGGGRLAPRQREHSRSLSASNNVRASTRSSSRPSSSHLDVHSSDESSRRRRTMSGNRHSMSPSSAHAKNVTRSAVRSQTDLSDRPRSSQSHAPQPAFSAEIRSTTDPIPGRSTEVEPVELPAGHGTSILPRSYARSPVRPDGALGQVELSTPSSSSLTPAATVVPPSDPPVVTRNSTHQSSVPATLSPSHAETISAAERATILSSTSSPTSSSHSAQRTQLPRFPEPSLTCSGCAKPHIEYDLHYNCYICSNSEWNLCLRCYRAGRGCLYWFGFGYAAWAKWEKQISSGELASDAERPHMLTANRYLPPKTFAGGADGRRTITPDDPQKRLQSGAFCANCTNWANECFWRCDLCNEGDWGFCNTCVNQGRCCTHPLLPLIYKPNETQTPHLGPLCDHATPSSATILTGPGVVAFGNFKPLTFRVDCDVCRYPIQPSSARYHCFTCISTLPGRSSGDYDICANCYAGLVAKKRISAENGYNGWRRCLQGHRTIVVGFQGTDGGQRRVIIHDLVGGRGLHEEPSRSHDHLGLDLQQWSWAGDNHIRLVTANVTASAPTSSTNLTLSNKFPPDGGLGMQASALWSWYPKEADGENELLFPRGATLSECVDVNGDWYFGVYMGAKGLFPAPYVKILDRGSAE